jgi:iron complex outermembrane receptor protein
MVYVKSLFFAGMVSRALACVALAGCLVAGTAVTPAGAQSEDDERLIREIATMDLDGLLNTKVTLGARTPEKWFRTSSAIHVITREDIRRSGMKLVPELLRMVPGVHVARIDANKWAISIRGFNNRFSSKLLVLVDGRIAYTPLFSGVYWDVQDLVLEDIDRIEVIRGPGASLWGANAMNGVINIVTREANDTHGGLAAVTVGNEETQTQIAARYGVGRNDFHLRAYVRYTDHGPGAFLGPDLSRNEGFFEPGTDAQDDWTQIHAGFRFDWDIGNRDRVSVFGDIYDGHFGQTRVVQSMTGLDAERDTVYASGGYGIVRWDRTYSERGDVMISLYYDYTKRHDAGLYETRNTVRADFQHRHRLGRHELMWGLEGWNSADETRRKSVVYFDPAERTLYNATAFLQDRIEIGHEGPFELTVGSKFGYNNLTEYEYQPNVRLLWAPSDTTTLWMSVSRAVRIPSRAESDLHIEVFPGSVLPVGNPDLESEELTAYELGGRFSAFHRFYVDVAGFLNDYRDLISDPANSGTARTIGAEVSSRWRATRFWEVTAGYSFIEFLEETPEEISTRPPRHMASARSYLDLPADFEFDVSLYYVDPSFTNMPKYTRLDLRLGWNPGSRVQLAGVIQNVLDDIHAESPEGTRINTGVRRSAQITARIMF